MNTPSSFIIKQGINMWYSKKLNIDTISEKYKEESFSETARQILNHKVVNHCKTHHMEGPTYTKLETKLGIKKVNIVKHGKIASR